MNSQLRTVRVGATVALAGLIWSGCEQVIDPVITADPGPEEVTNIVLTTSEGAVIMPEDVLSLAALNEPLTLKAAPQRADESIVTDAVLEFAVAPEGLVTLETTAPSDAEPGIWTIVLTSVANGEGALTVTALDSDLTDATAIATATAAFLVAQQAAFVIVTGADDGILDFVGDTEQFSATAHDANDAEILGVKVLWLSSDHNVAIVDENGLATATGSGVAKITAAVHGVPGRADLSVMQIPTSAVILNGDVLLQSLGQTSLLRAELRDDGGQPVPNGPAFTWTVSPETQTTIFLDQPSGQVTAVGDGVVDVTATATVSINGVDTEITSPSVQVTVDQLISSSQSSVVVVEGDTPLAELRANGTDAATIVVTLKDGLGNPIANKDINLSATAGAGQPVTGHVFAPGASGQTDADGKFESTISSTTWGDKEITAQVDNASELSNKPQVTFSASKLLWTDAPASSHNTGDPESSEAFFASVAFADNEDNVAQNTAGDIDVRLSDDAPASANFLSTEGPVTSRTVTASAGTAEFADVGVDLPGDYTLVASSDGYDDVNQALTVAPAVVAQLAVTALAFDEDDNATIDVPLPFDFTYFDRDLVAADPITVSTNGLVWFDDGLADGSHFSNADIPNVDPPGGFAAPFWDNLTTVSAYAQETIGPFTSGQAYAIEWRNVAFIGAETSTAHFALLLYANNNVEFVYGAPTGTDAARTSGGSATIGMEDFSADPVGVKHSFNTADAVTNGLRILYKFVAGQYVRAVHPGT